MVNEEAFVERRTGVNFNTTCHETGKLRDKAREEGDVRFVERVSDTVVKDGPQALVEQCFKDIAAGGVFFKNHVDSIRPARFAMWCRPRRGYMDARRKLW